jgi:hypothetical protein
MNRIFEQADPADWPKIVALLRSVELPLDGLLELLGTTLRLSVVQRLRYMVTWLCYALSLSTSLTKGMVWGMNSPKLPWTWLGSVALVEFIY